MNESIKLGDIPPPPILMFVPFLPIARGPLLEEAIVARNRVVTKLEPSSNHIWTECGIYSSRPMPTKPQL